MDKTALSERFRLLSYFHTGHVVFYALSDRVNPEPLDTFLQLIDTQRQSVLTT